FLSAPDQNHNQGLLCITSVGFRQGIRKFDDARNRALPGDNQVKTQTSFILLFGIVMLTLAACDRKQSDPAKSDATGMPDPAAEHCVKAGGKPETKDLDNGDQSSICVMPD